MKRIKSLLILCLFSLQLIAQETVTLKGVITAASDGSPIIGASVIIKGETKGTISDINGNFTLPNVKLGSTLKVTYIGMNPITIKVTSANVKIKMESSATERFDGFCIIRKRRKSHKNSSDLFRSRTTRAHRRSRSRAGRCNSGRCILYTNPWCKYNDGINRTSLCNRWYPFQYTK